METTRNSEQKSVLVNRVSPQQTLKRMEVGQTMVIGEKQIRYSVLYVTAKRLEKITDMRFTVTVKGIVGGTRVTRTA